MPSAKQNGLAHFYCRGAAWLRFWGSKDTFLYTNRANT